jgi:hypothetical protein
MPSKLNYYSFSSKFIPPPLYVMLYS